MSNETPASSVIERILNELGDQLGPEWHVVPQYLSASLKPKGGRIEGAPDIIVYGGEPESLWIIQVKGRSPGEELPLAVLPMLTEVQRINAPNGSRTVLVSLSHVPAHIEEVLRAQGIAVIGPDKDPLEGILAVVKT